LKELEANNKQLREERLEEEMRRRKLEEKQTGRMYSNKPSMVSKGKFMLNSDARAAHHGAEKGTGVHMLGSLNGQNGNKSPTDYKTNLGGSPIRVSRQLSPKGRSKPNFK
jgi:hypothetical protein